MQVIATLMSKSQLNVLEPEVTLILGLILSPLEGILILQSLLQVAIEIAHKQIINCGITAGVWWRGSIKLDKEKLSPFGSG